MRIWEKAGEFDSDKGSPLAWMATIARNRALDEVRRVRPVSLEDQPEGFEPAAEEVDPLGARERSEGLAGLINCLQGIGRREARDRLARLLPRLEPRGARQALRTAGPNDQDLAPPQPRAAPGLPQVMTISPDDDFAAAEYALGTLDASERATLAARRLREPELDEAIRAWEERLAPLVEAAPEIEPPGDLLPAIEARIRAASPEAPMNAAVVALERSVGLWRATAIAASACRRRARDRLRRARDDPAIRAARICGDPAEGRRFAGLRGDGQSR